MYLLSMSNYYNQVEAGKPFTAPFMKYGWCIWQHDRKETTLMPGKQQTYPSHNSVIKSHQMDHTVRAFDTNHL